MSVNALAALREAIGSLQRFSDSGVHANDPNLEAWLKAVSAGTSEALAALETNVHQFNPPPKLSQKCAGSLPHDVLAEIFKAWFEASDGYGCSDRGRRMPQGYVASSVNRRWRAVALATPPIWTRTVLDFEATVDMGSHIDTILSRSKSLVLDVSCRRALWRPDTDKKLPASLVAQLAELFSRCARLSISWRDSTRVRIYRDRMGFEDTLLPLLLAPMPHLVFLTLEGLSPRSFIGDILADTSILTLCPNLETLDLDFLPSRFIDPDTMPRLRSFTAKAFLSGDELSQLRETWPNLSALDIYGVRGGRPLALAELRTLKCQDAGIFRCIAAPADAPCLQHLSIVANVEFSRNLNEFLTPSPCASLRILELRSGAYRSDIAHFAGFFESLPALRELRLEELPAAEVLAFFTAWKQRVLEPPSLEAISVHQCSVDGVAMRALVNFLALRRKETGRLLPSLSLVQRGNLRDNYVIFPAWMRPRLEQLVQTLHLDVASAVVQIDPDRNLDILSSLEY